MKEKFQSALAFILRYAFLYLSFVTAFRGHGVSAFFFFSLYLFHCLPQFLQGLSEELAACLDDDCDDCDGCDGCWKMLDVGIEMPKHET